MEDTIEIPQKVKNRCSYSGLFIQNAAAANLLQSCPTLCNHRQQPTRLPHPWDSPGKNTGVGCHFLLQCMKVKSEREVTQSCLTLHDPMDRSLPGSAVHGIFQARVLEWCAISFSRWSSQPRDQTWVSRIAERFFKHSWTKYAMDLRMICMSINLIVMIALVTYDCRENHP